MQVPRSEIWNRSGHFVAPLTGFPLLGVCMPQTLRVRGWYQAVPLDCSFGPAPNGSREADSPLPGPSNRKSTVFSQNRANFGPSPGSPYKPRARAAQGKPQLGRSRARLSPQIHSGQLPPSSGTSAAQTPPGGSQRCQIPISTTTSRLIF